MSLPGFGFLNLVHGNERQEAALGGWLPQFYDKYGFAFPIPKRPQRSEEGEEEEEMRSKERDVTLGHGSSPTNPFVSKINNNNKTKLKRNEFYAVADRT